LAVELCRYTIASVVVRVTKLVGSAVSLKGTNISHVIKRRTALHVCEPLQLLYKFRSSERGFYFTPFVQVAGVTPLHSSPVKKLTVAHLILPCMELHDLYSSPSISRMIKSRRMRWAGHVTRMRVKRHTYRFVVKKSRGKQTTRKTKKSKT
jgi:hypothetical protein